ncbi:hypothetical protein SAMN05192541_11826 [Bradyrhizobium arachidis]|nr:hypothetical protein SAMN05192541_11826 [Bradyrhizobium arachidis]
MASGSGAGGRSGCVDISRRPWPCQCHLRDADIVTGLKNKIQTTVANVTTNEMLAKQHRKMAEPGTAKS